ncbi:ABC transporter substrate-binding protein [soil metagenome]
MKRKFLAVCATLTVGMFALSACSSDASNPSASSEDTSWSYVSGNGDTITLDHKPKRIIASAAEAGGLMEYGIKPVGIYLASDLESEPGLTKFDISDIPIVGEEWGKIDAEKVAALKPDLIVADWWPPQSAYQGFEEGADKGSMQVAKLAPIIGASQQGSLSDLIDWYEGFAKSMGVNVDSGKYAEKHKEFDETVVEFEEAVKAKPGLTALAVAPGDDLLYVAVPKYSTSLTDFQDWGLDVINPDSPKKDFPYWEYLSWEKADKYQPDLLLMDDRGYEDAIKTAERQPTWKKIDAGAAKAYTPWPGFWVHSYEDYADQLDTLIAAVKGADATVSG